MSLPTQIPLQSVPLGQVGKDGNLYVDLNWYLFLYNVGIQIFSAQGSGGGAPIQPVDYIDMVDLDATTTDTVQTARQLANAAALEGQDIELVSVDLQSIRRFLDNLALIESLDRDIPEIGPSLRDFSNALLLSTDPLSQDPTPRAQPVQTVTVGASPFTYTALSNGVLSVTAGTVSAISIIRQGTSVGTGITAGLIPVSRLDQVQITYTAVPTVVFLPN